MKSILEELYYGNIRPDSRRYAPDSPFVQAARRKQNALEQLTAALDASGKELLEQYCEAEGEMEGITRYDTFTYALKFGALFTAELFMGRGEITGES